MVMEDGGSQTQRSRNGPGVGCVPLMAQGGPASQPVKTKIIEYVSVLGNELSASDRMTSKKEQGPCL